MYSLAVCLIIFAAIPVPANSELPLPHLQHAVDSDEIWSECTDISPDSFLFRPKDVQLTPKSPVIGQDFEIKIQGTLKEKVEGGVIRAEIMAGLIRLSHDFSLCDSLQDYSSTIKCPVPEGDQFIVIKKQIPKEIPPFPIRGRITAHDKEGKLISCINIHLKLTSGDGGFAGFLNEQMVRAMRR